MSDQYQASLIKKCNQKRKERAMETVEEQETRLNQDRERKKRRLEAETESQREKCLEYQHKKSKQQRELKKAKWNQNQKRTDLEERSEEFLTTELNEFDREILQKF